MYVELVSEKLGVLKKFPEFTRTIVFFTLLRDQMYDKIVIRYQKGEKSNCS